MTNSTSRPSANGTTAPPGPGEGGQPVDAPVRSAGSISTASILPQGARADVLDALATAYPDYRAVAVRGTWREETRFRIWSLIARAKHVLGVHTMIPLEEWDGQSIRFTGRICWLCPRTEP